MEFLKKYQGYILAGVIVALFAYIISQDKPNNSEIVKQATISKVALVKPSCTPTEAKIILDGANLLKDANYVVLNLDNFKLTKKVIKGNKEYKYYLQYGKNDIYYTVATDYKRKLIKVDSNITKAN